MQLVTEASTLAGALGVVAPAVAVRATLPAMACVKLEAGADGLRLAATDGEVGIAFRAPGVAAREPGEVLVNPARLGAILKEAGGEVRLTLDGNTLHVATPTASYDLPTEPVASFPEMERPDVGPLLTLAGAEIGAALDRTAFACARDEGRYAMRGVLFDLATDALRLVATDGKRLALSRLGATIDTPVSCLLPPKAMGLLSRLCKDSPDEPAHVWLPRGTGLAHFAVGGGHLSSRLVEGRFPPFRDVIPKKFATSVWLPVEDFHRATRQTAIMADDESKRITYRFEPGRVCLEAQGATTGRAKVTLPLPDYSGPTVNISFDPTYLTDLLRALGGEGRVELRLDGGDKSALFVAGDYEHLIVPLV